jgi:hypothetical protein
MSALKMEYIYTWRGPWRRSFPYTYTQGVSLTQLYSSSSL